MRFGKKPKQPLKSRLISNNHSHVGTVTLSRLQVPTVLGSKFRLTTLSVVVALLISY